MAFLSLQGYISACKGMPSAFQRNLACCMFPYMLQRLQLTNSLKNCLQVNAVLSACSAAMQIGRDSRLSGPLLLASMVAGLASQGVSVAQFGLATTPAMFMSCIIPGMQPAAYARTEMQHVTFEDWSFLMLCVKHACKPDKLFGPLVVHPQTIFKLCFKPDLGCSDQQ